MSPAAAAGEVEALARDWARHKSPVHAASLVDAAIVLGDSSLGEEAALWILSSGGVSEISQRLAKHVLAEQVTERATDPLQVSLKDRHLRIASYRRLVRIAPRDPMLWVDLAREYAALGHLQHAARAIQVALDLAPTNRFVLRSASRFYFHADNPERAHDILLRSTATPRDPWLLAAEIAGAQANNRSSAFIKPARRVIELNSTPPRQLSELASALGTMELRDGTRKKARKYLSASLIDPTENSVAQAAWMARHMEGIDLPSASLDVPRAFEARAWEAVRAREYTLALELSWSWLYDEPFSARAALFGSWIASAAIGDYEIALSFVEFALPANSIDLRLLAQQLYCVATAKDTERAKGLLERLEQMGQKSLVHHSATEWAVLLEADRGLIAFREGRHADGRQHYREAIDRAVAGKLPLYEAAARLNYIREELRVNPGMPVDEGEIEDSINAYPPPTRVVVEEFVRRMRLVDRS